MILVSIISITLCIIFCYLYFQEKDENRILRTQYKKTIKEHDTIYAFLKYLGSLFTERIDFNTLIGNILKFSTEILESSAGAVYLLDKEKDILEPIAVEGAFPPLKRPTSEIMKKIITKGSYLKSYFLSQNISVSESVLGGVIQTGKPVLITDPAFESRLPRYSDPMLKIKDMIIVPLIIENDVRGVIALLNKKDSSSYGKTDLSLLSSLSDNAGIAIKNLEMYSSIVEKQKIDKDLRISKDIQYMLLPRKTIDIQGLGIANWSLSAKEIGGDYYDFIDLGKGKYGIVIGDVSGKSIPGALVMNMTRSILRTKAQTLNSASTVLREVNELVCEDIDPGMFISIAYLIIDEKTGLVNYARAGHEPLILHKASENKCSLVKPSGMVLGMDSGVFFNNTLEEHSFSTDPGDILILYTDGVTEAMDAEGEEFGVSKLIDTIVTSSQLSVKEIVAAIQERINRFTGRAVQEDDITLLVLKRK